MTGPRLLILVVLLSMLGSGVYIAGASQSKAATGSSQTAGASEHALRTASALKEAEGALGNGQTFVR